MSTVPNKNHAPGGREWAGEPGSLCGQPARYVSMDPGSPVTCGNCLRYMKFAEARAVEAARPSNSYCIAQLNQVMHNRHVATEAVIAAHAEWVASGDRMPLDAAIDELKTAMHLEDHPHDWEVRSDWPPHKVFDSPSDEGRYERPERS